MYIEKNKKRSLKFTRNYIFSKNHINYGFKLGINISLLVGIIILLILYVYRILKEKRQLQRLQEEINFLINSLKENPLGLQEGI